LAGDKYRVCTADRYGLGFSDLWNFTEPLTTEEQLRSQEEVLRKIGWIGKGKKNFHMIGYSIGGLLALEFVHKYPSQINRLILTDPLLSWELRDYHENIIAPFVSQLTAGKLLIDAGIVPIFWKLGLASPSLPYFRSTAEDNKILGYLLSTTVMTGSLEELQFGLRLIPGHFQHFTEVLNRKEVKILAMITPRFIDGMEDSAHSMWKKNHDAIAGFWEKHQNEFDLIDLKDKDHLFGVKEPEFYRDLWVNWLGKNKQQ